MSKVQPQVKPVKFKEVLESTKGDGQPKRFYRLYRESGAIHMVTVMVQNGEIVDALKSDEDILDIQHDKVSRLLLADMLTE